MMKKLFLILLALCLVGGSLAACKGNQTNATNTDTETETTHGGDAGTDTDTDTETDEAILPTGMVDFTLTVMDQDGDLLSGVTVVFSNEKGEVLSVISGENGVVTGTIVGGSYSLSMNDLPEGMLAGAYSYEFTPDTATGVLSVLDNNPDGTEARPFILVEETTEVTVPAGATYTFRLRGIDRTLRIENAQGLYVHYMNGDYEPGGENNVISIPNISAAKANEFSSFSLTNEGTEDKTVILEAGSVLGTSENPIVIESLTDPIEVTLVNGREICYRWTATVNGTLVYTCADPLNDAMMQSGSIVTERSNGATKMTIGITEGETVLVRVTFTGEEDSHTMTFSLHIGEIYLPEDEFV